MLFIAKLTHSTELCWAREENDEKVQEMMARLENPGEYGVEIQGSFVAPNEHAFYFLMEADDFGDISKFLGPPLLQDHRGDIVPVMTLKEAVEDLGED